MDEIKVKLAEDSFIHFTYLSRAHVIVSGGKLLSDAPHKEFVGIAGVQAVSVGHGRHVPGVQYDRLLNRDNDEILVAILFKTNTLPRIGYPEEIIWDNDVNLINPKIISKDKAVSMLTQNTKEVDDYTLMYESLFHELLEII